MKNRTKVIVRLVSAATLALVGVGGSVSRVLAGEGKEGHVTAKVSSIDRDARSLSLIDDDGQTMTVHVPESVKAFDKTQSGDRLAVTYRQSVAVAIVKPSDSSMKDGKGAGGGLACGGNVNTTANVISADRDKGELTFRGAGGQLKTVTVADPALGEKLGALHPGDIVQVIYTEPVAGSIAHAPKGK